jgi:hypothetical protein
MEKTRSARQPSTVASREVEPVGVTDLALARSGDQCLASVHARHPPG